jgi:hypothetical protein
MRSWAQGTKRWHTSACCTGLDLLSWIVTTSVRLGSIHGMVMSLEDCSERKGWWDRMLEWHAQRPMFTEHLFLALGFVMIGVFAELLVSLLRK